MTYAPRVRQLILRFTLALLTTGAFAQETNAPTSPDAAQISASTEQGTLYFKFVNSRTGVAVQTGLIYVDGLVTRSGQQAGGLVEIKLPAGQHNIRIESDGFHPIEMPVMIDGVQNPVMEIELDPEVEALVLEVAPDRSVLHGTITDADTAEPLEGAKVSIVESSLDLKTTATGEYEFEIETGPAAAARRPAVTLEAAAEGYQGVRMKNIALTPGGAVRIPVRLGRITSDTPSQAPIEIDEWTKPGSDFLSDWVFDVTLR